MIIKNNFNQKNVNPLEDYKGIGKGSHSLENELELERKGFIRSNMQDEVLKDLRNPVDNSNDNNDDDGDKWKFFR